MIKLHHYSEEKFSSFTAERQSKAIIELLITLEKNITDAEYADLLIEEILNCLDWLQPNLQIEFLELNDLPESSNPHDILRLIAPFINSYKPDVAEAEPDILRFDGVNNPKQEVRAPYPLTIVLDNLRSAYNVGSIFRTAECVQAKELLLCGITPFPPNPKLSKTAMQTIEHIKWQHLETTAAAIALLKSRNIPVIALETTSDAISLFDYKVTQPVGLILGNEALGIEEDIIKQADLVLSIPVLGWKNSLNVSNAFAIASYYLSGLSGK
jgi:tRNA G18 (ribose-2'-O)-methylase SpoU